MSEVKSEHFIEEAKKSYEILFEKIMFVDKYRMLKPHWIKFHNYIEKLQKEIEELRQNYDTATTKTEEQKEIYKKQEDLSLEDEPYFTDIF